MTEIRTPDVSAGCTVIAELIDAPASRPDHSTAYTFRPQWVTVSLGWNPEQRAWGLDSVKLTGPRHKKDGTDGEQRGARRFSYLGGKPDPYAEIGETHDWLVPIVQQLVTAGIEGTTPIPSEADRRSSVVSL